MEVGGHCARFGSKVKKVATEIQPPDGTVKGAVDIATTGAPWCSRDYPLLEGQPSDASHVGFPPVGEAPMSPRVRRSRALARPGPTHG
jgi:hypothetical protein